MLFVEGDQIILKEFSEDHMRDPRYFSWLRDLDVIKTIYRLEYLLPIQFEEIEKYVLSLLNSNHDCFFAIHLKDNDEFVGTQRIGHIEWRTGVADVGILIGEKKYWGKGLAKDSMRTACEYAFNVLSLRKLTGGTIASNKAMCRCFERIGFKLEGKLRGQLLFNSEYIDHILYGLFKTEFNFTKKDE